VVTFNAGINTTSLHTNNADCTVEFGHCSNITSVICKQIVYELTLADYQVPIKFKASHMRVCDVWDLSTMATFGLVVSMATQAYWKCASPSSLERLELLLLSS
jgi:hypothetical protein